MRGLATSTNDYVTMKGFAKIFGGLKPSGLRCSSIDLRHDKSRQVLSCGEVLQLEESIVVLERLFMHFKIEC